MELLQQTRYSKMSDSSDSSRGLFTSSCLFCLCQRTQSWYLKKRKKTFISLRRASVGQWVPLSQPLTARCSASTHWTEGRKTAGLPDVAFVRPALSNAVKLRFTTQLPEPHTAQPAQNTLSCAVFRIGLTIFVMMQEFYALEYISCSLSVISNCFLLYWQQFEHISIPLLLVTTTMCFM